MGASAAPTRRDSVILSVGKLTGAPPEAVWRVVADADLSPVAVNEAMARLGWGLRRYKLYPQPLTFDDWVLADGSRHPGHGFLLMSADRLYGAYRYGSVVVTVPDVRVAWFVVDTPTRLASETGEVERWH